jgi:glucose/arabinose dehydrogenase
MTGFWTEGEDKALVWGRPADVALGKDGTLFVVDDTGGTIWRVTPKADREATGSTKPRP